MTDRNTFTIRYLNDALARSHDAQWYRERFLVFVPSSSDDEAAHTSDALHSVVDVVEAPFLAQYARRYAPLLDFIFVSAAGEDRQLKRVRDFMAEQRQSQKFEVRDWRQNVVTSGQAREGLYFGQLVYAPPTTERHSVQTGRIYVEIRPKNENMPPIICEATFGENGHPVGLYSGQDRAIFQCALHGYAKLPMALSRVEQLKNRVFNQNSALAILPTTEFRDRPVVVQLRLEPSFITAIGNQDVPIQSLVAEGPDRSDVREELDFTDDNSAASVNVTRLLDDAEHSRFTARLVIEPDISYTRLRHRPDKVAESCFAILGVLFPAPVEENEVAEVQLAFNQLSHLIAHSLEVLDTAVLIKPKFRLYSSAIDQFTLVSRGGAWSQQQFTRRPRKRPVKLSNEHKISLLRQPLELPWPVKNKGLDNDTNGFGTLLRRGAPKLYCLTRNTDKGDAGVLGYFGCPVRAFISSDEDRSTIARDAGPNGPGTRPVSVRLTRRDPVEPEENSDPQSSFTLDWLNEAIVIAEKSIGSKTTTPIGLAHFWNQWSGKLRGFGIGKQRLAMARYTDGSSQLVLVESFGTEETETELIDRTVVRIGPLICQYRSNSASQIERA